MLTAFCTHDNGDGHAARKHTSDQMPAVPDCGAQQPGCAADQVGGVDDVAVEDKLRFWANSGLQTASGGG